VNYDLATSPAAVTVPGTVVQIGTSNSTQYALLADGSLAAWGLGTLGRLGDGRSQNSFTRRVRRGRVDLLDGEQRGHQRAPQDVTPSGARGSRPCPRGPAVPARPPRPALA
jgi:hypothetical protein